MSQSQQSTEGFKTKTIVVGGIRYTAAYSSVFAAYGMVVKFGKYPHKVALYGTRITLLEEMEKIAPLQVWYKEDDECNPTMDEEE